MRSTVTDLISILDGNTFVVSDGRGDIEESFDYPMGLFSFDTRFLSTWVLTLDGQRLGALSVNEENSYATTYFLVAGEPSHYVDAKISVQRQRVINGSFEETLSVRNHGTEAAEVTVRVEMAADFADLFEIKNAQRKQGTATADTSGGALRFVYRREKFHREVIITSSAEARVDARGMTFAIRIEPHGEWQTRLRAKARIIGANGRDFRESVPLGPDRPVPEIRDERRQFLESAPTLRCDSEALLLAYQRGIRDLAALRYESITLGMRLVAAGLPWFMTLFGRDSIFTCLQALPFLPGVVKPTIVMLAGLQGSRLDDFRDEEPGKILHELRYGELVGFEEQPHSPYYGSADSTPLFVVLLDEYERWTGDVDLVRRLEFPTRAALDWIDNYGNMLGTGYIYYKTRNPETGLLNQCWKDSPDAISYHDGRLPCYPLATCELQGYAYDAKMRGARLAREVWDDPAYAERLEREAAELKQRFNRDFWIADRECYATALDRDGGHVDSLSSNMGHLLWSRIVDEARAPAVARHLLGPALFSGWGVRTLATTEGRYNPIGYHVGTVWPFDNSIIAWGLARYGFRHEAGQIAAGIIDAARDFGGRLPEAFAGFPRDQTNYPVEYPTACSPQAWSAGAPLLLLRVLLGLRPHDGHLIIDPHVPEGLGRIELLDIPGRWGTIDALGRARDSVETGRLLSSRGLP